MSTQATMNIRQAMTMFIGVAFTPAMILGVMFMSRSSSGEAMVPTEYNHPFLYVSVALCTVAVISSILIHRIRLPLIREKTTLEEKLNGWRILFIVKIALIESCALVNIVFYFITGFEIFIYLAVAFIVYQFSNFPTRNKVQSELNLSEEESSRL